MYCYQQSLTPAFHIGARTGAIADRRAPWRAKHGLPDLNSPTSSRPPFLPSSNEVLIHGFANEVRGE